MSTTVVPERFLITTLQQVCGGWYDGALEFEKEHPFEKMNGFVEKDIQKIVENINNELINILKKVLCNTLAIDTAFCSIMVLINYANYGINQIEDASWRSYYISYLKLLFYFIIFGNLGVKYKHLIIFDKNDNDLNKNSALNYCIHQFIPNIEYNHNNNHNKYDYASEKRDIIISNLKNVIINLNIHNAHNIELNIATEIYNYTEYTFSLMLYAVGNYIRNCSRRNDFYCDQFNAFNLMYCESKVTVNLVSELLLSSSFINTNNELRFYSNQLAFESLNYYNNDKWRIASYLFTDHQRINFWSSPYDAIDLFRMCIYHQLVADGNKYQKNLLKDCLLQDKHKFSLFFNGNNEYINDTICIDDDILVEYCANIHIIFDSIIYKYFDLNNNNDIAQVILYQCTNAANYFISFLSCNNPNKFQIGIMKTYSKYILSILSIIDRDKLFENEKHRKSTVKYLEFLKNKKHILKQTTKRKYDEMMDNNNNNSKHINKRRRI